MTQLLLYSLGIMKKITFIWLMIVPASVSAEWSYLGLNEITGKSYWYENNRIRKKGDHVWVWQRQRFSKPSPSIGGMSAEVYLKINCGEYSYQKMQYRIFKKKNWINQISSDYDPHVIPIAPDSQTEKLADIICKERPVLDSEIRRR